MPGSIRSIWRWRSRAAWRGGPEAVYLYTVADSTQIALRELVGITKLDQQGRGLVAAHDRRSKLDAVLDLLLAGLVVTAPWLAASLRITPQCAASLLQILRAASLIKRVRGR
jgi:hypothetical protein